MDARYFLIATDGRHYGPLTQDDIRVWLGDGRANRYCRARREHEERWLPLRELEEFEPDTRPPDLGFRLPPADEEKTDGDAQPPRAEWITAGRLDPVSCFQRAWPVLLLDLPVLVGWTLLASILTGVAGMVPRIGLGVAFIVDQLLRGGIYVLFLSRMRGRPASAAQAASIVAGLSTTIVIAAIAQVTLSLIGLVLLIAPGIYLIVCYAFVVPVIVDKKLPFWEAMELSRTTVHAQWLPTFGLLLAQAVLILVGYLAAGIGLIVALPICTAALMVAYEDLFGGRP